MSKSIVIITGASSGMGYEFAMQIDAGFRKTDEIWLVARRERELRNLSRRMRNNTRIFPLDVTKENDLDVLSKALHEENCRIRMLVNCAGFGLIGNFSDLDRKEQLEMVRLNCEALTSFTHRCIPYMEKNSRLIQLASSAAFVPQPGFAVYAATKAYVNSFTLALREELKEKGIVVTSVCPGPVDTPFFKRAEKNGTMLGIKKLTMVTPGFVVEKALRDSCFKKSVSVCSIIMQAFCLMCKIVPHGILLPIIFKMKRESDK